MAEEDRGYRGPATDRRIFLRNAGLAAAGALLMSAGGWLMNDGADYAGNAVDVSAAAGRATSLQRRRLLDTQSDNDAVAVARLTSSGASLTAAGAAIGYLGLRELNESGNLDTIKRRIPQGIRHAAGTVFRRPRRR